MSKSNQPENEVSLWPEVSRFIVYYIGLALLAGGALYLLDVSSNIGVNVSILVVALYAAVHKFVLKHKRPFTRGEQLRFAGLACLASLLAAGALVSVSTLVVMEQNGLPTTAELLALVNSDAIFLVIAVIVVSALYIAILYLTSGWFSRLLAKRLTTNRT